MAADDADDAARVIERLLADPAFRADFRRDPATACRDAGLDELAEYMSYGAGKAMHTLDIRESRSSLAGVMMAAALEGIGVFEFAKHIAPAAIAVPGAARDVLSRVNLPSVDAALALRGALARTPEVAAGGADAEDAAADPGAPGVGAPAGAPGATQSAVAPAPMPAQPPAPAPDDDAAATPDPPADAAAAAAPADAPAGQPASAAPIQPQAAAAPVDPAQFGIGGTGGAPSPEALALLENRNIVLGSAGVADIKAGRLDPRVVTVLTKLSEAHKITISAVSSDHGKFTSGGSVSNHYVGRGIDIAAIDGVPVNADNAMAREVASALSDLDATFRPEEVGTPWAISAPGYFTDAAHQDHLHVAFDQAIDPSFTPPAVQAPADTAAPAAAVPAEAGTLSIAVPREDAGSKEGSGTLRVRIPEAAGVAGTAVAAPDAGSGAVAENFVRSGAAEPAAGAKALAALAEAMKHKGTPYLWGGSNPQTGFDCSGLVQWAYAKQGIEIPRVTDQQILAKNGTAVDRKDLVPGDLVFFRDPTGYVYHVGISLGGDKFLAAPRTGDVVKESSLDEPYYAQRFTGGRRFDDTPAGAPAAKPAPAAVDAAAAALARDAAAVANSNSLMFKALTRQEASNQGSTVRFMRAVRPEEANQPGQFQRAAFDGPSGPLDYPGDDAPKTQIAAWMGRKAEAAGLPRELPVMAALVESGLTNVQGGDRDSVGFFQMRLGIWNKGEYAGYPDNPDLQLKWFIDTALRAKEQQPERGQAASLTDPKLLAKLLGMWAADVERPQEDLRYKYELRFTQAHKLVGGES